MFPFGDVVMMMQVTTTGDHVDHGKYTQEIQGSVRFNYRQVSNIRRTLVGNKINDHSDVVGASPVGAAPTTSSFSS